MDNPKEVIERRIQILAAIMNQDPKRLLKWAYFDAILGAAWDAEDNGDPSNRLETAKLFDQILSEKLS